MKSLYLLTVIPVVRWSDFLSEAFQASGLRPAATISYGGCRLLILYTVTRAR
jgi:hypothetical protein